MADNTQNESISEVVPTVLGEYLVDKVSDLREYYPEFPSANMSLAIPSVSIFANVNDFRALPPYLKNPVDPADIQDNKSNVDYVVGIYDLSVQVDLWAGSKEARDDLLDQLFNALNPDITPMGLRLGMEDYFDQICEYLYVGHTFADSEERSQRDEWRVTLNLLATCNAVRTKKEFVITDTQTPSEIEQDGEIDFTVSE